MIQITKSDIIKDMKRVAKKVKTFTRKAYRSNGAYSSWVAEARFGTFTKAVQASKVLNKF